MGMPSIPRLPTEAPQTCPDKPAHLQQQAEELSGGGQPLWVPHLLVPSRKALHLRRTGRKRQLLSTPIAATVQ